MTAEKPEKLHFGICFQYDLEDTSELPESDHKISEELQSIITKYVDKCKITVDRINYKDAKNAYYARHRV